MFGQCNTVPLDTSTRHFAISMCGLRETDRAGKRERERESEREGNRERARERERVPIEPYEIPFGSAEVTSPLLPIA